ncbi:MAG: hydroxymethylglutaryl-CoA lyase [Pseudomonadota bacterium]
MIDAVRIVEVGPRDGLQNEAKVIDTKDKIHLINLLSDCGFNKIEATNFLSPEWVPQMLDSYEVLTGIKRNQNINYTALVSNMNGYRQAKQANVNEIAIFVSASESFSQQNIKCSIKESLDNLQPIVDAAQNDNIPVRGYVSCVVKCPYDGDVAPESVADVSRQMLAMGCYEIALGDTIGQGTPETIHLMLDKVLDIAPAEKLAAHYHNTNGLALHNIAASLGKGIRIFDSSVGGIGGCPFVHGAKGNIATRDVINLLHKFGFATHIDLEKLSAAEQYVARIFGHENNFNQEDELHNSL